MEEDAAEFDVLVIRYLYFNCAARTASLYQKKGQPACAAAPLAILKSTAWVVEPEPHFTPQN